MAEGVALAIVEGIGREVGGRGGGGDVGVALGFVAGNSVERVGAVEDFGGGLALDDGSRSSGGDAGSEEEERENLHVGVFEEFCVEVGRIICRNRKW